MKLYNKNISIDEKAIDLNRHVNNVKYVEWMNDVVLEHSSKVGDTIEYQKEHGYMWVAKSHHIDYISSSYEGDELVLKTWVEEYKKTASIRHYEFIKEDKVIVKAQTVFVCLNLQTLRPIKIPEDTVKFYC